MNVTQKASNAQLKIALKTPLNLFRCKLYKEQKNKVSIKCMCGYITTGCGNKKRPHYKSCNICKTVQECK